MSITKVALVGANGNLGPAILQSLLAAESFTTTVISRSNSRSTYPKTVEVAHTSDDPSVEELAGILRGQDALVVAFAGSNDVLQIRYADAAAQAGVKRFIPADFGSCDSSSPLALELMPIYRAKQRVRQHLQQLAAVDKLSWTSLVCGHLFDWGLRTGFLQFDLKARRALIFDQGDRSWSTTTTGTVGAAVVGILRKEGETRNRMLYIQSFCVCQNDVLKVLEDSSGQKWQVEHVSSDQYIKDTQAKLKVKPDDAEEWENMVAVVGMIEGNWENKHDFANGLLGLETEKLDEVVTASIGP